MTHLKPPASPLAVCEDILRKSKQYNLEHHCLPSENRVIDRLLNRGHELESTYLELHRKLGHHPHALQEFLAKLLSTAAFWKPEDMKAARASRYRLIEVNREIADKAMELSTLLDERSVLHNHSGFASNTHYHVCEVIEEASEHNPLFGMEIGDKLSRLHYQYDLKYWPSLSDFMDELAQDASDADIEATDPLTKAATESSRSSKGDFLRAFLAAIEESSAQVFGRLPSDLKITDNTMASLINCALELKVDEMASADYVKRFRQKERERSRRTSYWTSASN
ncbi:hypothetical protein AAG584_21075 [Vreelandella titanicae]|uniref:hypothetical protein n=1 Tax=Vreelandella titanicae TaxID=664683 RepID=UPI00315AADAD